MKNLRFERVNMKLVIIIATAVIALLTVAFIIFRTNLIIDHKDKNEKEPVVENPGGNKDPENPENPDNPDDPNNPGGTTNPSNPGGNTDPSNPGGNTDPDDPSIYDDPEDEGEISKAVKERTKKAKDLTVVEKEYVIKENIEKEILKDKDMQANCGGEYFCVLEVDRYLTYSSDKEIGKKIEGCKGNIITAYNKEEKKVEFDLVELKCE